MKEYQKCTQEMLGFIRKSPTCFHAVAELERKFGENEFDKWEETQRFSPAPGGKYYVTRNESSVIALTIPANLETVKGFHITASHSDSPSFKVKESPENVAAGKYVRLNTEKYGGMILSTWLDRPLSVAGRIAYKEAGVLKTKLVNVDSDLCIIPNVAIHMNRDMNSGVAYNPQTDMLPLFTMKGENDENYDLFDVVVAEGQINKDDIMGHDLFLYTREKGGLLGATGEFVYSPRLDDLQCAYAASEAFVQTAPTEYINVCAVFDNEEVGSGTRQGADSTFLEDVLYRVALGLGQSREEYLRWIAGSFLISADNAHAVHPNHPEKADPTNRPYLNGGIVIKYHGSQKYTTDALSGAKMKNWCQEAGVPFQTYTNRSDIPGGSTLGNISTAHVAVESVDIGLPQLSMHSAVETAGTMDTLYAIEAIKMFYRE